MATRKPCNLSYGSLPSPMDFIDLTVESPIHRSSQTSSNSTVRSQRYLDTKPNSLALHKDVTGNLDATVTVTTRTTPTISWCSTSETKRAARSNARVRLTVKTSNKSRSGSKNQRKREAKLDETINLDDTVLPEPSSSWHTNNSSTLICAICLEELHSECKPTATRCGHIFCEKCLNQAMSKLKLCPQCRTKITKKSCIKLHF